MLDAELEEMLDRVADGSGYGDPDARLNDDRRTQILIAKQQSQIAKRLNLLTMLIVIVGGLNVGVMTAQIWVK